MTMSLLHRTEQSAPLPPLALGEVHVHVVDLDATPAALSVLSATLSEDELSRAARFRFARHRDRYVAGRGILRVLLGDYLHEAPARVGLRTGQYGRPELAAQPGGSWLDFNLSHSAGIALFAFAWDRRVGVDVEIVRDDLDHRALADRFFAPAEKAELRSVGDAVLAETFFSCWTRKEAVVKAHGAGLSLPLKSFEVSARPNDRPRLVWRSTVGSEDDWRIETLRPRSKVIGALAVKGEPWTLASFDHRQVVSGSSARPV